MFEQPISPSSVAEQAIIGCVLIDNTTLAIAREIIKPDDFFSKCNQMIFSSMCASEDSGKQITIASVLVDLMNDPSFSEAGGVNYLTDCSSQCPSAQSVTHYAKIVRDESIKRKVGLFGETLKKISQNRVEDIDAEISKLSDELLSLTSTSKITPWMDFRSAVQSACNDLLNNETSCVIPSGFIDLDAKITGLRPGALTIIAARPAMGKTAFGLNLMQYAAFKLNIPVAFFSLEMTADELVNRTISCMSSINGNAIRQKRLNDSEWNRLLDVAAKYSEARIYIDETAAIDISILRERARRLHKQHGIKLIIIDYLQLITSGSRRVQSREQEVACVSRCLKEIAKELRVPVVALAQLNRAVDARTNKQPVLSDLRESGSIEQDADNIIFIHREDYYKPNETPTNEAEIIIAKQRSGPTGIVKLHWEGEYTRFSNLEQDAQF
jgi:replicative DNA helicase